MSSSTSSSSVGGLRTPRLLLREAGPAVAVALALVAAAEAVYVASGRDFEPTVEMILLEEQSRRAAEIGAPGLLLIGDSAGLNDIDPVLLGRLIGRRVETLATVAWVGPRGYAAILARVRGRLERTPDLLLAVHPVTLALDEETFDANGFETMAVTGHLQRPRIFPGHGARRLLGGLVSSAVSLPLPGHYGRRFGTIEDFRAFVRAGNGSVFDPSPALSETRSLPPAPVAFSGAILRRLPVLREEVARWNPARVRILVMPSPAACVPSGRADDLAGLPAALAAEIGLSETAVVPMPLVWPDERFTSPTHLTEAGRGVYTEALAAALSSPAAAAP